MLAVLVGAALMGPGAWFALKKYEARLADRIRSDVESKMLSLAGTAAAGHAAPRLRSMKTPCGTCRCRSRRPRRCGRRASTRTAARRGLRAPTSTAARRPPRRIRRGPGAVLLWRPTRHNRGARRRSRRRRRPRSRRSSPSCGRASRPSRRRSSPRSRSCAPASTSSSGRRRTHPPTPPIECTARMRPLLVGVADARLGRERGPRRRTGLAHDPAAARGRVGGGGRRAGACEEKTDSPGSRMGTEEKAYSPGSRIPSSEPPGSRSARGTARFARLLRARAPPVAEAVDVAQTTRPPPRSHSPPATMGGRIRTVD